MCGCARVAWSMMASFHPLFTDRNHLEEKKGMISADLVFWCIVGNPFENFNICYFAIVAPPKKSRSNWASEAARSGRGPLGFKGVGVWILGVLIFLIPTGSARFRSIKKQGGRFLGALHPPKVYMDGLIILEVWKKHHFPWTEWVMAVGSFRRSSSRVSRDGMLTQTFLPRSSWKGRWCGFLTSGHQCSRGATSSKLELLLWQKCDPKKWCNKCVK